MAEHEMLDGGGFVQEGAVVIPERSWAACALASGPDGLVLAWAGSDHKLNLLRSPDGVSFGAKRTFSHTTRSAQVVPAGTTPVVTSTAPPPALAAGPDGVHLAWTGSDSRLNLWRLDLGDEGHVVLDERSYQGPALAGGPGGVHLAWTGTDRRLNLLRFTPGAPTEPWHLPDTSDHGPALCDTGAGLVLAWTGGDRRLNVRPTAVTGPPWTSNHTSDAAPALAVVEDEVVLAWRGGDRRLNLAALRGDALVAHVVTPATSGYGPALAVHDGLLVLAWTGGDQRLNVARVRRVR